MGGKYCVGLPPLTLLKQALYTDNNINMLPLNAAPINVPSGAVAWAFGIWGQISAGIANDIIIVGVYIDERFTGWNRAIVGQIGIGAIAAEVPIIDVGLALNQVIAAAGQTHYKMSELFSLSVPRRVPANTRIVCRATDNQAVAIDTGFRILYQDLPL